MVCVQEYFPVCSLSSQNECRRCPIAVWERQSLVDVRAMLVAVGLETGETQLCLSREWGVVLFLAFSVKLGRVWVACFSLVLLLVLKPVRCIEGDPFVGFELLPYPFSQDVFPVISQEISFSKQTVLKGRNTSLLSICSVGRISVAIQFTTTAHV